MILFVGRLLETMALWCAAGSGQVDDLPAGWGCRRPWRLRGQGRPEAVAAAIASATLEAGGTAGHAARRATALLLPVVECAWFRAG